MASKLAGRTTRDITTAAPLWEILDSWAQQTGYMPVGHDNVSRLYQRGVGFWMAPQMLQVTWMGDHYTLQAWVRVPLYSRIMIFMLMPAEVTIDSGGFMASLPRKQAREHINMLLQSLGQPLIA